MISSEIRRANARTLLASECGGTPTVFAERLGKALSQVNHIIGPNPTKNIGTKLAREIETVFGMPRGWLDADHSQGLSDDALLAGQLVDLCPESVRAEVLHHVKLLVRMHTQDADGATRRKIEALIDGGPEHVIER